MLSDAVLWICDNLLCDAACLLRRDVLLYDGPNVLCAGSDVCQRNCEWRIGCPAAGPGANQLSHAGRDDD